MIEYSSQQFLCVHVREVKFLSEISLVRIKAIPLQRYLNTALRETCVSAHRTSRIAKDTASEDCPLPAAGTQTCSGDAVHTQHT